MADFDTIRVQMAHAKALHEARHAAQAFADKYMDILRFKFYNYTNCT